MDDNSYDENEDLPREADDILKNLERDHEDIESADLIDQDDGNEDGEVDELNFDR